MACGQFINGIIKDCFGNKGGIKEVWISSNHSNLEYTINNGVITMISDNKLGEGRVGNFVKFEFGKGGASMSSKANIDNSSNLYSVSTDLQLTFSKIDTPKRLEMEKLLKAKDLVVIVGDNNGLYWLLGRDNPVNVSSSNGNFGSKKNDSNNYQITLTDVSYEHPLQCLYLPWEHITKSSISVYETTNSNILQRDNWIFSNGFEVELGTRKVSISYTGDNEFLGWYNGKDGTLITESSIHFFDAKESDYVFVALVRMNKPITPTWTSQITLYRTESDDVKDNTQWIVDRTRLIGSGEVPLDKITGISYKGGLTDTFTFQGWYDSYGKLITTNTLYRFYVEDESYILIAKTKPYTPTEQSTIKLYRTTSNDITEQTQWVSDNQRLLGSGKVDKGEDWVISYNGGTSDIYDFKGWFLPSGRPLTSDTAYSFNVVDNSYTFIAKAPYKNMNLTVTVTSTEGFTELDYFGNGTIIDKRYEKDENIVSVYIGNEITYIGNGVFQDCINLSSVTIPNSVISIGTSAFTNCSNLTSIIIPNSISVIDGYTFQGCTNLTSITIPNSITAINQRAFYNCVNLEDIYYNDTKESFESIKFGMRWEGNVPETCIVHCTDGDYPITDLLYISMN